MCYFGAEWHRALLKHFYLFGSVDSGCDTCCLSCSHCVFAYLHYGSTPSRAQGNRAEKRKRKQSEFVPVKCAIIRPCIPAHFFPTSRALPHHALPNHGPTAGAPHRTDWLVPPRRYDPTADTDEDDEPVAAGGGVDSEEEEEEEEEEAVPPAASSDDDDDSDSSDEEPPAEPQKTPAKRTAAAKAQAKPKPSTAVARIATEGSESESESESEDEGEDEAEAEETPGVAPEEIQYTRRPRGPLASLAAGGAARPADAPAGASADAELPAALPDYVPGDPDAVAAAFRLYIGGLPFTHSEAQIKAAFGECLLAAVRAAPPAASLLARTRLGLFRHGAWAA